MTWFSDLLDQISKGNAEVIIIILLLILLISIIWVFYKYGSKFGARSTQSIQSEPRTKSQDQASTQNQTINFDGGDQLDKTIMEHVVNLRYTQIPEVLSKINQITNSINDMSKDIDRVEKSGKSQIAELLKEVLDLKENVLVPNYDQINQLIKIMDAVVKSISDSAVDRREDVEVSYDVEDLGYHSRDFDSYNATVQKMINKKKEDKKKRKKGDSLFEALRSGDE